ncbi:hypothetical protein CBL_12418 [Carabus blaptoides fortunei]
MRLDDQIVFAVQVYSSPESIRDLPGLVVYTECQLPCVIRLAAGEPPAFDRCADNGVGLRGRIQCVPLPPSTWRNEEQPGPSLQKIHPGHIQLKSTVHTSAPLMLYHQRYQGERVNLDLSSAAIFEKEDVLTHYRYALKETQTSALKVKYRRSHHRSRKHSRNTNQTDTLYPSLESIEKYERRITDERQRLESMAALVVSVVLQFGLSPSDGHER